MKQAQAYTPALQVAPRTIVRKLRELPLPGTVLVTPGTQVRAETAVLSAELPGDLTIVRIADRLGFEPEEVLSGIKVKKGDTVKEGDLLCEVKTFFNLFTSSLVSPASGVVEFLTEANAHLGIRHAPSPLTIEAYVDGTVVETEPGKSVTIECRCAFIQGIFGVGGERRGRIMVLPVENDEKVTAAHLRALKEPLAGRVLIGGAFFEPDALAEAGAAGAAGVVCGSIDAETLFAYVGEEIGVSITGDEDVPCTLIITEGFGTLPLSDRVRTLAETLDGRHASINGATQVRAGATRPEIIVPVEQQDAADAGYFEESKPLEIGARMRIIRVPYFGAFGTITALPSEPEVIPSGAHVRVLRATLDTGEEVTVPRANVELV